MTTPGTCTAQAAVGADCTISGISLGNPCLAGAYDDDSSGQCVCVAAQANGAACTESDQCSSGFCDTGNTNTCIIEPQVSSLSTSACTEAFQSGSFF